MTLPAYKVVFAADGNTKRSLSVAEFLEMPLDVRVRAILERRVDFFLDGAEVPRHDALNAIRRASLLAS